ncbi:MULTISPECIES: hypothetical protein [Stenotrophomonas]|uniref:hypothetical protein n=1 Tax=Stenotrophomonas TaxID=40323 RepID=UPI001140B85B|nr:MULTISPECIES: hypothetical protein [Stenotrophomonas]MDQ1061856.1 hypothetical protein [Stenotrophomonas sp. SORGH_AS_0282]MDQ1189791.1 hypothetical protein [Stenotrophomonas sp. SORGH_AS_0282]UQY86695.1 hypothetical protein LQE85_14535 [Stenotrophomonas rhizophila]
MIAVTLAHPAGLRLGAMMIPKELSSHSVGRIIPPQVFRIERPHGPAPASARPNPATISNTTLPRSDQTTNGSQKCERDVDPALYARSANRHLDNRY